MDTKVTDSVQEFLLETGCSQALTENLEAQLAKGPALTLVLFVGEGYSGATSEEKRTIKTDMDDVEQLLLACFRRSDRVVRCGEASCAAILADTGSEGALHAVQRFQRMLARCKPLTVPLHVGMACSGEQRSECQALLAQALKPTLCIVPSSQEELVMVPEKHEGDDGKSAISLASFRSGGVHEKAGKTNGHHVKQVLALSPTAAFSSEPGLRVVSSGETLPFGESSTRARARTLGVPYIAPPQHIPNSVLSLLSVEVMRQLHCLPIGRDRNSLTVALADPTDRGVVQRLEQLTGLTIFPVMTDPDALEALAKPVRSRRVSQVTSPAARPSGD